MSAKETILGNIDDAVLNFTVGKDIFLDKLLVDFDCISTAAHANLGKVGLLYQPESHTKICIECILEEDGTLWKLFGIGIQLCLFPDHLRHLSKLLVLYLHGCIKKVVSIVFICEFKCSI